MFVLSCCVVSSIDFNVLTLTFSSPSLVQCLHKIVFKSKCMRVLLPLKAIGRSLFLWSLWDRRWRMASFPDTGSRYLWWEKFKSWIIPKGLFSSVIQSCMTKWESISRGCWVTQEMRGRVSLRVLSSILSLHTPPHQPWLTPWFSMHPKSAVGQIVNETNKQRELAQYIFDAIHNGNWYIWGVANVGMRATVWQTRESSHLPDLSFFCAAFPSLIPLVLFAIVTNVMAEWFLLYPDRICCWCVYVDHSQGSICLAGKLEDRASVSYHGKSRACIFVCSAPEEK